MKFFLSAALTLASVVQPAAAGGLWLDGGSYTPAVVIQQAEAALAKLAQYLKGGAFNSFPPPTGYAPSKPPSSSGSCSYWLEEVKHQGIAAFNPNPTTYQVFRNVKDYGAVGDGVADDTAAINAAISAGDRCGFEGCSSTTVTPALVYFPAGTYLVSSPILDYYYTTIVGNPNCVPTIKVAPGFTLPTGTVGVIEADPYTATGSLTYGATNVFWRGVRNLIVDMTAYPAGKALTGIHWPTAQATSLQNMVFKMSDAPGTQHAAILVESGSGGFMTDLVFYGGLKAVSFANQQFTMRNFTFYNTVVAVSQLFDWSWTYQGFSINNCSLGINMSSTAVGAVNFIDSSISNTPVGILTSREPGSQPEAAGTLILENVNLNNVQVAVKEFSSGAPLLAGSTGPSTISAWGQGNAYDPNGPRVFQGPITPNARPGSLLSGSRYYTQSKPQYNNVPLSGIISARSQGATGDGHTDDTLALNRAIAIAAATGKVLFLDQGDYLVTSTIFVPPNAKIIGEAYSVILSSGRFFANEDFPQPVVQVGFPGAFGTVAMSDIIISSQGAQPGAIMLEVNLRSPSNNPSGYWDVHTRLGGFAGSDLQLAECPVTPTSKTINKNCIAAFMSAYLTPFSSGQYFENNWFWTADHDVEVPAQTQITIYTGRGLLVKSPGPNWFYGTAVEHHALYQYQFDDAATVFAGFIQTETAYYQPNPDAPKPFNVNPFFGDPTSYAPVTLAGGPAGTDGWGLRIVNSQNILIYGAGHYSFFYNNNVTCSNQGNGLRCQNQIIEFVECSGRGNSIYSLATVGSEYMFTVDGQPKGYYLDNPDGFTQTIGILRP